MIDFRDYKIGDSVYCLRVCPRRIDNNSYIIAEYKAKIEALIPGEGTFGHSGELIIRYNDGENIQVHNNRVYSSKKLLLIDWLDFLKFSLEKCEGEENNE